MQWETLQSSGNWGSGVATSLPVWFRNAQFRWIYTKKNLQILSYKIHYLRSVTQLAGVMRVLIWVVSPSSRWELHFCLTTPSSVMIQILLPLCHNFHVVSWWAYSAIVPLSGKGCFEFHCLFWTPLTPLSAIIVNGALHSMGACGSVWVFSRGVMQSLSGSRLGDSVPRVTLRVGAGQDCAAGRETKGTLSSPFVLFRPVYLLE